MQDFVTVGFKKLNVNAKMPSYAHDGDSGLDVCSIEDTVILGHTFKLIDTGLAPNLPKGYEIQVRPRSGLQCKKGIIAGFGTVDSGYHGSIKVVLFNTTSEDFVVSTGDRIAQFVVAPVTKATVAEVVDLDASDRGANGFGSTGK